MNIFSPKNKPVDHPNRNVFDLSKACHGTGKIGQIIPVLCQEVMPGDSFEIDSAFGVKFAPMVFPMQTRMHASMHFFYTRNRNVYEDWEDYIFGNKEGLEIPYHAPLGAGALEMFKSGHLLDFLGVPTSLGNHGVLDVFHRAVDLNYRVAIAGQPPVRDWYDDYIRPYYIVDFATLIPDHLPADFTMRNIMTNSAPAQNLLGSTIFALYPCSSPVQTLHKPAEGNAEYVILSRSRLFPDSRQDVSLSFLFSYGDNLGDSVPFAKIQDVRAKFNTDGTISMQVGNDIDEVIWNDIVTQHNDTNVYVSVVFDYQYIGILFDFYPNEDETKTQCAFTHLYYKSSASALVDAVDVNMSPFYNPSQPKDPACRISALPARHYDSIFHSFYQHQEQDPFKPAGTPEYNEFVRNKQGGFDQLVYDLHNYPWEYDYFTSCQQDPQQGNAPLVGVSASGVFTFEDLDTHTTYQAQTTIGEDGETIVGISTYDDGTPTQSLRKLADAISQGISINDFRRVNSFQRWLENNIRKGRRYHEQMLSHFGVQPNFKLYDEPEFIGGVHSPVDVSQVTNTSASLDAPLGEVGAQAGAFGNGRTIHKYFDEHGYVMAVLIVYPEPVYSQALPKHFLKTQSKLDFYTPEFANIGFMPVNYDELCPIEAHKEDIISPDPSGDSYLDKTFGYQMAYSDYKGNFDSIHGQLRTTENSAVVTRTFDGCPELGHDFVTIKQEDLNNVFVVTSNQNPEHFRFQCRFRISAKRPMPLFGKPSLE